ncbi:MAG: MBL fold metallo-hydrolase [Deltaproteobacteria bacterium]|nr:MBL fold metallo-hydrolase [Deltaproteobacteria bacterium]
MTMKVRFYGVRGSIATAGAETARYGGNTSCVVVETGEAPLIFDAGTGLRKVGAELAKTMGPGHVNAHLFLSHLHWDHIQGFPFFTPAFVPGNQVSVWGVRPAEADAADTRVVDAVDEEADPPTLQLNPSGRDPDPKDGVKAALAGQMRAPNFPVGLEAMRADLRFFDVPYGERILLSPFVTVSHIGVDHPNGCVAWRVDCGGRSVVYATDLELAEGEGGHVFDDLVELARGADLLIFDAMYTPEEYEGKAGMSRKGWGHSTYEMGARVCEKAGVASLALFHHDPAHDDAFMDQLGERARARFARTFVAREGQEVAL